jgi:hypothetical protein
MAFLHSECGLRNLTYYWIIRGIGDRFRCLLEESQNKNRDSCPLFSIRGKDQDIERLKRGGCYEREKKRGKGKQEGAAEKPQREEKGEEGEERPLGTYLENHSGT